MSTVLVDTHVLFWSATAPDRLSVRANEALRAADGVAVAAITWYELAWLASHERIAVPSPLRSWLEQLSRTIRTVSITPAIADTAAALPAAFSGDPADRLIYATAVELGVPLVSRDRRMRQHRHPRPIVVW